MLYQIIPALCLILSGAPIDVYCLVRGLGNTIVTSDHLQQTAEHILSTTIDYS